MSQERPVRTYMVGDEVRMTVELVHEMNLVGVYVIFRHETGEIAPELLLADEAVPHFQRIAGGKKRSEWKPEGKVGLEHKPGLYNLHHINVHTAGERTIVLKPEETLRPGPERSFQVIAEPDTMPYFGGVEFVQP